MSVFRVQLSWLNCHVSASDHIFHLPQDEAYQRSFFTDHISLMRQRVKGIQNSIKSNKEILSERKGGINLKWEAVPNLADEDLKLRLFSLGYTTSNVDSAVNFVRSNQKAVNDLIDKLRDEKHELAIMEKELLKDKSDFEIAHYKLYFPFISI